MIELESSRDSTQGMLAKGCGGGGGGEGKWKENSIVENNVKRAS